MGWDGQKSLRAAISRAKHAWKQSMPPYSRYLPTSRYTIRGRVLGDSSATDAAWDQDCDWSVSGTRGGRMLLLLE